MSTTEAAIQINFKTKRDGMLINLRANDAIELDGLLNAITERLATLVDLETTVESFASNAQVAPQSIPSVITDAFPSTKVVSETQFVSHPPAMQNNPQVQGYTPQKPAPFCTCGAGAMRLVPAGIAKATGRPYKGFYACP